MSDYRFSRLDGLHVKIYLISQTTPLSNYHLHLLVKKLILKKLLPLPGHKVSDYKPAFIVQNVAKEVACKYCTIFPYEIIKFIVTQPCA